MSRRLVGAFGLAVAAAALAVVRVGFVVDEGSILHSVSDVFLHTPPPPPLLSMEGGLNIVDDPPSICCGDGRLRVVRCERRATFERIMDAQAAQSFPKQH